MDVVGSLAALTVLAPLMLVVALMVVATSRGGVFFQGERIGLDGTPFRILKFRSMVPDAEGAGKWNVSLNDPRVTPVGRFLRASKLDELPQFINVLRGEMSLVGPRPELQYYVDMYTEEEAKVLTMKPGLTDWASLANYSQYKEFTVAHDPDQHYLLNIRPLKLHLQQYMLTNQSFINDFRVLLWTAANVFSKKSRLPTDVEQVIRSFQHKDNRMWSSNG